MRKVIWFKGNFIFITSNVVSKGKARHFVMSLNIIHLLVGLGVNFSQKSYKKSALKATVGFDSQY